jgi:hypothetical protein
MEFEELKAELKKYSLSRFINKFLLNEKTICFPGNEDLILDIKEAIANHFHVHAKNIEVVGSAKLGVSLNNKRLGKSYDSGSDLDLVIVSSELFDRVWLDLSQLELKKYSLGEKDRTMLEDCCSNIRDGNIRPDMLPDKLSFKGHWWGIFNKVSNKKQYENRDIRGRLFKNWFFVEKYYSIQLVKIKGG